jgi:hypothetical protein
MTGEFMIQLFLNDLLVNSACRKDKNYVENKRKEWIFLKQALKTKSVTAVVTDRFLLHFNSTKVDIFSNNNTCFGNFNFSCTVYRAPKKRSNRIITINTTKFRFLLLYK